uniref:Uncharacterized protein n=1 Tax=Lepeophtheirus salmonis TaxID=72036 RepID=A0A0K2V7C6_LEPSM
MYLAVHFFSLTSLISSCSPTIRPLSAPSNPLSDLLHHIQPPLLLIHPST